MAALVFSALDVVLSAAAAELRDVQQRLLDPAYLLPVFSRVLPERAADAIRVTGCRARPARTASARAAIAAGRLQFVYEIGIDGGREPPRTIAMLGVAPVDAEFTQGAGRAATGGVLRHPGPAPFRESALYLAELRLGLFLFPCDPVLPGVAAFAAAGAERLLEPHLPECRAGARIERCAAEVRHYKPFNRAVLRADVQLSQWARTRTALYLKFFDDARGASIHRALASLWSAVRDSDVLRVPEPLGYDPQLGMLAMREVAGEHALGDWIRCLEHGEPLPAGVDLPRVGRCVDACAHALCALQRTRPVIEQRRTFADELASLHARRALLTADARGAAPQIAARTLALLDRLERLAPRGETLVPAHGTFRPKQTLGDERALTIIDWDSLCLASPALDAATFLARLRKEPLRRPGSAPAMVALAEHFRNGFLALQPQAAAQLDRYEGLVLTGQLFDLLLHAADGGRLDERATGILHCAERMLERAGANGTP